MERGSRPPAGVGNPLNRSGPLDPSKEQYGEFTAAELFCPRCGTAVPVREKLLLILPDGELYEYLCVHCGASLGDKTTKGKENIRIVIS